MSLIGDALRKTRQEAAERESDRKGVLFSAKIGHSPTRSNLGLGLALGAIIAAAATVAGGSAVWWLLSRGETGQPLTVEQGPSVEAVGIETDRAAPVPTQSLPVGSDSQTQALHDGELGPAPTSDADPKDLGSQQPAVQARAAVETPAPTTPNETSTEGGFAGVENGADVYILEAKLGKVQLSLDFIIFRPVDPFAEINGIELHIGGVIEGYRVKVIERDRVHLSNGRKDIILRTP